MTRAETRREIERALRRQAPTNTQSLAKATGYERATVAEHLLELRERGRAERRPNPLDPRQYLHEPTAQEVPADD